MAQDEHLFTSESVTEGHPDKIADQISDAVLDAILAQDPQRPGGLRDAAHHRPGGRGRRDHHVLLRRHSRARPRTRSRTSATSTPRWGSTATRAASSRPSTSSLRTSRSGVDKEGAGDQGLMFGYACRETEELMPLPIMLCHRLVERLSQVRRNGTLDYLRPDGKSQVSVRYRDGKPVAVETIVVSTQHADHVGQDQIRNDIIQHVILPVVPAGAHRSRPRSSTTSTRPGASSPAGRWATPVSPAARSSSTPTAAPARTAAAPSRARTRRRWTARAPTWRATSPRTSWRPAWPSARRCRWRTRSGCRSRCPSWSRPTAPAQVTERQLEEIVRRQFDFRPRAIIEYLDLRRPIFRKTAAFGHFGRRDPDFTWETDRPREGPPQRRRDLARLRGPLEPDRR